MDRGQDNIYWQGRLGGGWIKQKGKRTHGYGQHYGGCGTGIRGWNGNGRNTIKNKILKNETKFLAMCSNSPPEDLTEFADGKNK